MQIYREFLLGNNNSILQRVLTTLFADDETKAQQAWTLFQNHNVKLYDEKSEIAIDSFANFLKIVSDKSITFNPGIFVAKMKNYLEIANENGLCVSEPFAYSTAPNKLPDQAKYYCEDNDGSDELVGFIIEKDDV